jgi:hypothetical protein
MMDFAGVKAITIPEGSVTKIMRGSEVLWEKPPATGIAVHISFSDQDGATTRFLGELGTLTVGEITITAAEMDITLPSGTSTVTVTYLLTKRINNRRNVSVNGTNIGQVRDANSKVSTTVNIESGGTITIAMTS